MKMEARSALDALLLALILALAGTMIQAGAQEAPNPAGHWDGTIQVPGQGLGINVDLAVEDGAWSGDISIPVQQTEDFPLAGITVDGLRVSFKMAGVPGDPSFQGTLSADGGTLTGTFTQGGQSFPFNLERQG